MSLRYSNDAIQIYPSSFFNSHVKTNGFDYLKYY